MKWLLLSVSIVGIVVGTMLVFSHSKPAATISSRTSQDLTAHIAFEYVQIVPSSELIGPGFPVHLKIPRINVDATIERVGLTSDGAMDIPKSPNDVAWYALGPRPGDSGSAVIAGHYGWKDGNGSVFDDLHTLRKGDNIYIKDDRGAMVSFVVRESRRYDSTADASNVFISSDGKAHLNLITCEGVWNTVSEGYSKRLVVFTDKE